MKKQFILLAVAGLVLTSCGIYTKYQRPEDITTDGLYGHDLATTIRSECKSLSIN